MIRSFKRVSQVKKSGHTARTGGKPTTDPIYKKGNTDASQKSMPRQKRWDDTGEKC